VPAFLLLASPLLTPLFDLLARAADGDDRTPKE
jgi:hypothetical protein